MRRAAGVRSGTVRRRRRLSAAGHSSTCSGGRGCLPRSRPGLARSQPLPCEPRTIEGDECNRALSHGGARRPCRALRERGVRPYGDLVQLLWQPALPKVPRCGVTPMAGRPRSRAVAGAILSRRHAAERTARHRLPEQARDLQPADEGGGRDNARHRERSQAPRRTDRRHRRAANLGLGACI